MMVRIQNEDSKSFPQPVVFVLSMDFIQFPMIFIFHSTHMVLSLLVSVPHKNSAKLLSNMSLIHWMFWASSAANSTNYTRKSVPCFLAYVPLVPVVSRVLLLPAGMAEGAGTTGILDHPDYSNPVIIISSPSRQGVFHIKLQGNRSPPNHYSNCCFILGYETELFSNPWLCITTSFSK